MCINQQQACAAGALLTIAVAQGLWCDDFDAYEPGLPDFTDARAAFVEDPPDSGIFLVTEGGEMAVPVTADDPEQQALTVTVTGLPPGAEFAPTSGAAPFDATFTWTPSFGASPAQPSCCDLVTKIITPGPAEIIGPPGEPVITEPTMAIIVSLAEQIAGGPLDPTQEAILELGVSEGSGIGYAQGFGIGLTWVQRQVCGTEPDPSPTPKPCRPARRPPLASR